MTAENFLSMVGLGQLVDQDFFIVQVGLLGGSVIFFFLSLVLCIMAFRATMAARNARNESEAYFESAQDLAKEVRHLTAQVEQTMSGERTSLEDATSGIAAASVPSAAMLIEDSVGGDDATVEEKIDHQSTGITSNPTQKASGRAPRSSDDTLSFVDAEDPFKTQDTEIVEGAVCELVDDPETTASASEDADRMSPLSKLLRRRQA